MALEAIKQASNYAQPSNQINTNVNATPAVNGVTQKQAANPKNDFSLDETAATYGEQAVSARQVDENISNNNEALKKAVDTINKKMNNSVAQFGIHEATNRVTIKIVDKETKKVLKEFPPEETLDMIAKVWELAGIMVDEKK